MIYLSKWIKFENGSNPVALFSSLFLCYCINGSWHWAATDTFFISLEANKLKRWISYSPYFALTQWQPLLLYIHNRRNKSCMNTFQNMWQGIHFQMSSLLYHFFLYTYDNCWDKYLILLYFIWCDQCILILRQKWQKRLNHPSRQLRFGRKNIYCLYLMLFNFVTA